jgi:RNA polymerase sigma factor (sigma-70 family)
VFLRARAAAAKRGERVGLQSADAEDLAEEAVVRVIRTTPSLASLDLKHLFARMAAAARDKLIDVVRARFRRAPPVDLGTRTDIAALESRSKNFVAVLGLTAKPGDEGLAALLSVERRRRLRQIISELPRRQRLVLLRHELHGDSFGAIARRLDVSKRTVQRDFLRARLAAIKRLADSELRERPKRQR